MPEQSTPPEDSVEGDEKSCMFAFHAIFAEIDVGDKHIDEHC